MTQARWLLLHSTVEQVINKPGRYTYEREACLVNMTAKPSKKEPLELSEEETCLLLEQTPETLPSGLVEKIADYGIWRDFITLAGRNIALAIQAGQWGTNDANR